MTPILRLEIAQVMRARWLVGTLLAAALVVAFFVALATRESAILAFTGYTRVVTGVGTAALLGLPLLALFATTQAVTAARAARRSTPRVSWWMARRSTV